MISSEVVRNFEVMKTELMVKRAFLYISNQPFLVSPYYQEIESARSVAEWTNKMRSILQCDPGKSVTAAAHMACHRATMACYYATMPPTHQRCIMDRAPISRRFVIGSLPNGSLFHYHCRLRSEARPTEVFFITIAYMYPCRFANGLESSSLLWMDAVA